ncbi:hypothetical protein HHI36_003582 [Cryptolaemus montrouzieri]|uniref:Uncharacterized protein n=1 Tax=Cryptolaemus montrouzieri TaxID=559131 RepID=A0ABD2PFA7_9CUCU
MIWKLWNSSKYYNVPVYTYLEIDNIEKSLIKISINSNSTVRVINEVTAGKMLRITVIIVLVAVVFVHCKPADKYTTKYDNVDLDEILKSDRLINSYFNCLISNDGKRCTPDGAELRRDLPDALKNGCAKCSEKQKSGSRRIINHIIKHKKNLWDQIEKKYDPQGVYIKKYQAELSKSS